MSTPLVPESGDELAHPNIFGTLLQQPYTTRRALTFDHTIRILLPFGNSIWRRQG